MKRFILVFIALWGLHFTTTINAQQIDSIAVYPKGLIVPMDTVKIYIHTTFTSGGCSGTALYGQSGFNINASSLHCVGPLAVICHDVDTVILNPPHNVGTYTFSYVLSSGFGFPCTPGIVPDDRDTAFFTVSPFPPFDIPPTVTSINDDTICNNDSSVFKIFNVIDDDLFSVVVTGRSSNQSIIPDSNVIIVPGGFAFSVQTIPLPGSKGNVTITITAVDSSNQKDSTTFDLLVQDCNVGIKDKSSKALSIYPNPNKGSFNVQLEQAYKNVKVRIYSSLGEELFNEEYINTSKVSISEEFNPGVYYLVVEIEGRKEVRAFVVEE